MTETNRTEQQPTDAKDRNVYEVAGPYAHFVKATLQMLVGVTALVVLLSQAMLSLWHGTTGMRMQAEVFLIVGIALAIAASIELAYTLFTDGPDEALDPIMLGVAAALILQLGRVERFVWSEGLTALLYVGALAGLFLIRSHLADVKDVAGVNLWFRWKRRRAQRLAEDCKLAEKP